MFTKKDKIDEHRRICENIHRLYKSKNNDYGDSVAETYEKYGMDSFLVRMTDKLNRVYSLTRPGIEQKVMDEKIEDTLLDLANYAIIAVVERRSKNTNITGVTNVLSNGIKIAKIPDQGAAFFMDTNDNQENNTTEEDINNHIPRIN